MDAFKQLGLSEPLSAALASFGFQGPTPVQTAAIPLLLSRRDAFIESETGTGKTFAYLAPAFQLLAGSPRRPVGEPGLLVASPTQELAVQIGKECERLAAAAGLSVRTAVLLGGTPLDKQVAKLKDRPDVVVGTLGRLVDLMRIGRLKVSALRFLVLDEADRLFANETEDAVMALLKSLSAGTCRVLVSATLPERMRREARPFLRDAAEISAKGEPVMAGNIEHWCFYCDSRKRLDFLRRFEAAIRPARCLVFISAAGKVASAVERMAGIGLPVAGIHAGLEKEERRVALERFSGGELRYLVTSDLGARGLDIPAVSHILSLDLPEEPTVYTHRAGRTGRAGATGVSIVLADGMDLARASKLAVRGGFIFRCKTLEGGAVLEPTAEEFFGRAAKAEEERMAAKAARAAEEAPRGARARGSYGPRPDRPSAGRDRPSAGRDRPSAGRDRPSAGRDRPEPRDRPAGREGTTSRDARTRNAQSESDRGGGSARAPIRADSQGMGPRPAPRSPTRPSGGFRDGDSRPKLEVGSRGRRDGGGDRGRDGGFDPGGARTRSDGPGDGRGGADVPRRPTRGAPSRVRGKDGPGGINPAKAPNRSHGRAGERIPEGAPGHGPREGQGGAKSGGRDAARGGARSGGRDAARGGARSGGRAGDSSYPRAPRDQKAGPKRATKRPASGG